MKSCSRSPYQNQGAVECSDCGRDVREEVATAVDSKRFHHCPRCWEDGVKQDRCYACASTVHNWLL